ncbi:hypothetical protein VNI00_014431 [Paramarasmius palmivorus]|uniref:Transmembrane protein n=1 Tax=Paramarasmius palmivorus TaxID=297713 RepID=A0AAW0BTA2_9AGAR
MAAPQSDVMVVVDETSSTFQFDDSHWVVNKGRWYGDTSMYANKASVASGEPASFSFSFYGTSVAISGVSRIENSPSFSVAIDSQQSSSLTFSEMAMNTEWYTSQILPDELHQITVSDLDQVVVDYAIVTPGDSTPLQGSTIAVDDSSPEIVYHGNWRKETGQTFNTTLELFVRPLRNTIHTSTAPGDSFVFQFAGTSVSVHGFLSLKVAGSFAITFTIDDMPTLMSFPPSNSRFDPDRITQPHFPFYQSPSLRSGNHTLIVNVTGLVGDQSFVMDHLTYTASFSRLSEKPNFQVASSQGQPETTNSAASSMPSGQSDSQTECTRSSKGRTGAIVGGVVGGVIALLVLFATVFLLIMKRQRAEQRNTQALMAEPFPGSSESSRLGLPANTPLPQKYSDSKPLSPAFKLRSTRDTSTTSGTGSSVRQMEVQQRLDQITLLESRIEEAWSTRHSSVDVDALYAEIDRLKRENERLERGYQPPPSYAKAIGVRSETHR